MDQSRIERLLNDLKEPDADVRDRASAMLWQLWFHQKGVYGFQQLMQAQSLLELGQVIQAEALLSDIVQAQPDFAEAWNRRAVLHYTQANHWRAIADCQKVIHLLPYHFGALHGLGLCHSAVGNYTAAIQAFRQALEIQPYAVANQRMILECTAKLG
ncbi:MAG: tetratricopeptide repeat protein [Phormidesmis sp. RL_2_1]|nr:tetratricopeptide repeat protein [Phormidesmis sp. RL_2_1]